MNESELTPTAPVLVGRRLWTALLVAAWVCGLVTVAAVSLWVKRRAELYVVDSPPPERIKFNAPFIKSPDVVVDKMIEVADLSPDDLVYDLGCGDGRIVITAALQSGCRGVGVDIDPERVAEARENVRLHGVEHLVEIRQQDLFEVDLSEADVVMCYLLPWMVKELIPQLQEMKPASRFLSHDFGFGDITYIPPDVSEAVLLSESRKVHHVRMWRMPLQVPEED